MAFDTPAGTRGARAPRSSGPVMRWISRWMERRIRRKGYRLMGMDVLFLTTIGRKTGVRRETPVAWFPAGQDAWLIVASAAGSPRNPDWYRNLAAHPDQVWIELPGRKLKVVAEQLSGAPRAECWQRITAAQSRYAKYQQKTDRELPVIRLVACPPES
ncbi:MAG TPA: nitroreductase/quinone reductase family protein [Thermopolyspora sp.]